MNKNLAKLGLLGFVAALGSVSGAFFTDNFDVDSSANWDINKGPNPANNYANFAVDYSIYNIPSAPSSGGTTKGLLMEANVTGSIFSGLSVSPKNYGVSGDFEITADVWMNYVGPGPGGGSGSTQIGGLGWGTAGSTAQWAGGTQDSVYFVTTTDGNSASDYRAYSSAAPTSYPSGNAVYAAPGGGINNSNAYYQAAFPSVALPGTQNGFGTQTGTTLAGSTGFAWRKWQIKRVGNSITYKIDNLLIATVDASTLTFGGNKPLITFFDSNTASTTSTSRLNFMLVDNYQVVPEPASMVALGAGALALIRRRKA